MLSSTQAIRAKFRLEHNERTRLDVNLQLPGEGVTAIFGHSGSGKTSFLRCMSGLVKASGELYVNENCWQSERYFRSPHKRSIAYVFQESSLFAHLTARDNIQYGLRRCSLNTTKTEVQKIIELMGLDHCLDRLPAQLSGGERQRVAIARALLMQPDLLLMDEPLASLDDARKQEIMPCLEAIREERKTPTLYVSHSLAEVSRLADHLVVLEEGRAITSGPLQQVLAEMNFAKNLSDEAGVVIEARVEERDHQWQLLKVAFTGGELWLQDNGAELGSVARVRLLAKDVSLALGNESDMSILNRLPSQVLEVEKNTKGAMALVKLKVGEAHVLARLSRRSIEQLNISPGKTVWAQIKSAAMIG